MTIFEWDQAKFTVSVTAMDDEHKKLIALMNALYDVNQKGGDKAALKGPLKALVDYTVKHFADEEAYMASVNFPDLKLHQGIHKSLLDRVGQFAQEFEAEGKFSEDFFSFLKVWLTAHIQGVDRKYGAYKK